MKYFLHDTNAFSDEKITELYMNFGYEGLGLFYTILEKLALQEKPIKTIVLKKQLNIGKRLNKCWNFLESLDIISSNNGETFNKQLLNFSEKYSIKKEKNRKRISDWRENQANTKNVTCYEHVRNTPKVKESKVNKSKVNIIKENKEKFYNEFLECYKDFNFGKKIRVLPEINSKSFRNYKKARDNINFEDLKLNINNYLDYLFAANWRAKKSFEAWINNSEYYANDWEAEAKKEYSKSNTKQNETYNEQDTIEIASSIARTFGNDRPE